MDHSSPLRERYNGQSPLRRRVATASSIDLVRVVMPELLDELPQNSPDAQASRRDLRNLNRLLGSTGWFKKILREKHQPGELVLEIGAGTGELGRALNTVVPVLAGLDLCRRPADWPNLAPWYENDVLRFTHWADYPIVIGNLFFHHFGNTGLSELGANLNEYARVIIASEPLRVRRTERLFSLVCPLIRANAVTRYDGRVSIAAGFRHDELPHLLRLDPLIWGWCVQENWLGSCRMVAVRRA